MDLLNMPDHMPSVVLGFDFGTQKIGVASGQSVTGTASALPPLKAVNGQPVDWNDIQRLIDHWRPDAVVVGVPINMDGTTQPLTFRAIKFAKRIHGRFGVPVYGQDERLSSKAAHERIGRNNAGNHGLDSAAATIILEDWLAAVSLHLGG